MNPVTAMNIAVRKVLDDNREALPAHLADVRLSLEQDLLGPRPSYETIEVVTQYAAPVSENGPGSNLQLSVLLMLVYTEPTGRGKDNAEEIWWWLSNLLATRTTTDADSRWQVAWQAANPPAPLARGNEVGVSWLIELPGDMWMSTGWEFVDTGHVADDFVGSQPS